MRRTMTPMKIEDARAAAADWVAQEGHRYQGYRGAYFSGSTVGLTDGAVLPVSTDVDIMLVTERPVEGLKLGKFEHQGALLEVTYLSWEQISPAATALANYHIAGGRPARAPSGVRRRPGPRRLRLPDLPRPEAGLRAPAVPPARHLPPA